MMLSDAEIKKLRSKHGDLFTRKTMLHPASSQGVVVRKVTVETTEPPAVHDTAIECASGDLCIQLDRLHYQGSLPVHAAEGQAKSLYDAHA